jgi:hypothetical protein
MNLLDKYDLNFDKSLMYFKDNLENTNELSKKILEEIDFKNGTFFTYLPNGTEKTKALLFTYGGIAIGVRKQINNIILHILQSDTPICCVFDDVASSFKNGLSYPLFDNFGCHYEEEVYYALENKLATNDALSKCVRASNSIWHSLCVLTHVGFLDITHKKLTNAKLSEICKKAQILILGAYDGEGYIFWEKIKD